MAFPHIEWIDLENNHILVEIAVVKRDHNDNVYYIRLDSLDEIDKMRLVKILSGRNATHYELWDLMSTNTLNNGMNSLDYFHQLVKMRTPNGQLLPAKLGQLGVAQSQRAPNAKVAAKATKQQVKPKRKYTRRK